MEVIPTLIQKKYKCKYLLIYFEDYSKFNISLELFSVEGPSADLQDNVGPKIIVKNKDNVLID